MFRKDIDVLFTNTVKEYMDKGLVIDPYSMRGSQTHEVGKVDLTDGKDVYRVLLEDGHVTNDKESFFSSIDYLKLSVRLYTGGDTQPHKPRTFTPWNNEGELLTERFFYQFENNTFDPSCERRRMKSDNPWYTEDLSAVQAANRKHWERRKARLFFTLDEYHDYPESAKTVLLPLVRRLPRCKTVRLNDIGRVYRASRGSRSVVCVYVKGNCHDIYLGREESA